MRHRRIVLFNPNTNAQATALMLDSARRSLPLFASIEGHTASRGVALITDEAALDAAAPVVVEFGLGLRNPGFDALVIAAFGDPGLAIFAREDGYSRGRHCRGRHPRGR